MILLSYKQKSLDVIDFGIHPKMTELNFNHEH